MMTYRSLLKVCPSSGNVEIGKAALVVNTERLSQVDHIYLAELIFLHTYGLPKQQGSIEFTTPTRVHCGQGKGRRYETDL